jgi:hypothetical protein
VYTIKLLEMKQRGRSLDEYDWKKEERPGEGLEKKKIQPGGFQHTNSV